MALTFRPIQGFKLLPERESSSERTPDSWTNAVKSCDEAERLKAFGTFVAAPVKRETRELTQALRTIRDAEETRLLRAAALVIAEEAIDYAKEMAFFGDRSVSSPTSLATQWLQWWVRGGNTVEPEYEIYTVRVPYKDDEPMPAPTTLREALPTLHHYVMERRWNCTVWRGNTQILCCHNNGHHHGVDNNLTEEEYEILCENSPRFRGISRT